MAIIHQATIKPTKPELLAVVLGGPAEVVGSYRFDDPAGEVGVEGFVVRHDGVLRHVVFTYRGAPLDEPGARLVSTMEHSALGPRWVYDGRTDPVAVECFRRALAGEQEQASLEVWADGERVRTLDPTIRLTARGTDKPGGELRFADELVPADGGSGGPALVATWDEGAAVVAELASVGHVDEA